MEEVGGWEFGVFSYFWIFQLMQIKVDSEELQSKKTRWRSGGKLWVVFCFSLAAEAQRQEKLSQ